MPKDTTDYSISDFEDYKNVFIEVTKWTAMHMSKMMNGIKSVEAKNILWQYRYHLKNLINPSAAEAWTFWNDKVNSMAVDILAKVTAIVLTI